MFLLSTFYSVKLGVFYNNNLKHKFQVVDRDGVRSFASIKFYLTFINSDNLDPQLVHFNEDIP